MTTSVCLSERVTISKQSFQSYPFEKTAHKVWWDVKVVGDSTCNVYILQDSQVKKFEAGEPYRTVYKLTFTKESKDEREVFGDEGYVLIVQNPHDSSLEVDISRGHEQRNQNWSGATAGGIAAAVMLILCGCFCFCGVMIGIISLIVFFIQKCKLCKFENLTFEGSSVEDTVIDFEKLQLGVLPKSKKTIKEPLLENQVIAEDTTSRENDRPTDDALTNVPLSPADSQPSNEP